MPLHYARKRTYEEVLQLLLSQKKIEINMEDNERKPELQSSVESNYIAYLKQLLSHHDLGINATDKYGCTPLRVSVEYC